MSIRFSRTQEETRERFWRGFAPLRIYDAVNNDSLQSECAVCACFICQRKIGDLVVRARDSTGGKSTIYSGGEHKQQRVGNRLLSYLNAQFVSVYIHIQRPMHHWNCARLKINYSKAGIPLLFIFWLRVMNIHFPSQWAHLNMLTVKC